MMIEIPYNKKYLNSTSSLIKKTWSYYNSYYNIINDDLLVYKALIEFTLIDSNYTKLLINNNKVEALFFANTDFNNNLKKKYKRLFLYFKYGFKVLILRKIKPVNNVIKFFKEYKAILNSISDLYKELGAEINLFITSKNIRGKNYGKKLLNDFINNCNKQQIKGIFLLTDKGCNYTYYDKMGFRCEKEFYSRVLDKNTKKINGFIYTKIF